jgi:5'-nucleotidase/UDP-sugar diphosphatase
MRTTKLIGALVSSLATGCVAYNDQCQPLVADPAEQVATLGEEVFLDRPNARHANNLIGQVATDAFVWMFGDSGAPVTFAVTNGGSIRAEGLCVTRNILKSGPLTNGVLHEILLFESPVYSVDLTEDEVWLMFEHSVERLYASGSAIASPFGGFLQVSKEIALSVDCSLPAGSRVAALSIGGQAVARPGRAEVRYRVAVPAFILGGGDGYTMLSGKGSDPSRSPKLAQRFGGIDSNITAAYLRQLPKEVGLTKAGRLSFSGCAVPVRPSN